MLCCTRSSSGLSPQVVCFSQTEAAFEAALEALRGANVELVRLDMGLLVDLGNKHLPDPIFYSYEAPREVSR